MEVDALAKRLESGKLRPQSAYELSYTLVSAVAGRIREFTAQDFAELIHRYCAADEARAILEQEGSASPAVLDAAAPMV